MCKLTEENYDWAFSGIDVYHAGVVYSDVNWEYMKHAPAGSVWTDKGTAVCRIERGSSTVDFVELGGSVVDVGLVVVGGDVEEDEVDWQLCDIVLAANYEEVTSRGFTYYHFQRKPGWTGRCWSPHNNILPDSDSSSLSRKVVHI